MPGPYGRGTRKRPGFAWPEGKLKHALPDSFVFFDFAVADVDDAPGVLGDVVLVGDQHDGVALLVEALEQAP